MIKNEMGGGQENREKTEYPNLSREEIDHDEDAADHHGREDELVHHTLKNTRRLNKTL